MLPWVRWVPARNHRYRRARPQVLRPLIDGWLFAEYAAVVRSTLDLGGTGQVYANSDFIELETLGVRVGLEPGETAQHREVWRVWPAPDSRRDAVALAEAAG